MKRNLLFLALLFTSCCVCAQTTAKVVPGFPSLAGLNHVRDFTLAASGDEAYFTIQSPNEDLAIIACIKKVKGSWSQPALVTFTGTYRDIEPFIAPNGLRLYFSSNRPLTDTAKGAEDYNIWYVERKTIKDAWSAPINIGAPVNTAHNEFYPSLGNSGNLYYTSDAAGAAAKDDIYFSKWNGKSYETPVVLDSNINSSGYEFNAYVSPKENFIIYTGYNRKGGLGSGDLYISQKDKNGNWTKARNMGSAVNSPYMDYCPYFHAATNTLYFTSKRNNIVPRRFTSVREFTQVIGQYENGLSRIYKVVLTNLVDRVQ
jgi:WD40-like Beta Propeller Repeat